MDDQIKNVNGRYPRLEPEPVRSVQRVTAVRSARKERCVKEGKTRTRAGVIPLCHGTIPCWRHS